jgi:hypothetical protein
LSDKLAGKPNGVNTLRGWVATDQIRKPIANHEIHKIHEVKTGLNMSTQRKQKWTEVAALRRLTSNGQRLRALQSDRRGQSCPPAPVDITRNQDWVDLTAKNTKIGKKESGLSVFLAFLCHSASSSTCHPAVFH